MLLVGITGFILGFVLSLQSAPTLKDFGAESFVPGMVAISVIREMGSVIIALICTTQEKNNGAQKTVVVPETIASGMEEKELTGIIAEAQKALGEKRLKDKK
ncbi:ABC transporter permease [Pararcticibacter amylolyticus]|uniref:ABC transporter permease n=1 Tax=Pararcticibacter amylolyticus TaxID=2173175 RepID=UPI0021D2BA94|nr:ABC transporter permease [Pararcticibacter amylolyticus]